MLEADLVVCSGGMSVYEIAALGTPGVVLGQNAREDRRMREFARHGTVEYLGLGTEVDEAALLAAPSGALLERRRAAAGDERAGPRPGGRPGAPPARRRLVLEQRRGSTVEAESGDAER